MIVLNKIYTDKEYMEQGFTKEECPLIRKHDLLFNRYVLEGLTEKERDELEDLRVFLRL